MEELISNAVIGAVIGFLSGMFGIGGSSVATPLLKIFTSLPPIMAVASPLPAAIPAAVSGFFIYKKEKLINYRIALLSLLSAIPTGLFGTYLTKFINPYILVTATILFLFLIGFRFFLNDWFYKEKDAPVNASLPRILIAGMIAGLMSGLLAIGGGIIFVPAYIKLNNLKIKSAVATSLFSVGILAIIISIAHYVMGHIDIFTSLVLVFSVIPFAYLGAKSATHLRSKTLQKVFGAALIIFAIIFIADKILI